MSILPGLSSRILATGETFCQQCFSTDFEAVFASPIGSFDGRPIVHRGGINLSLSDPECPLCIFLLRALELQSCLGEVCHLRAFAKDYIFRRNGLKLSVPNDDRVATLTVGKGSGITGGTAVNSSKTDMYPNPEEFLIEYRGFIAPTSNDSATCSLSILEGNNIDLCQIQYVQVQGWLDRCENSYTSSCGIKADV